MKQKTKYLFWLYLAFLFFILFYPSLHSRMEENTMNLTPFSGMSIYIFYFDQFPLWVVFVNLIGNILAFVPFGFLLSRLFTRMKWFEISLLTAMCSFFVECLQFHFRLGTFDIDDIILNTFGGLLGFLIYKTCRATFYKLQSILI